jgi:hypothetical protein
MAVAFRFVGDFFKNILLVSYCYHYISLLYIYIYTCVCVILYMLFGELKIGMDSALMCVICQPFDPTVPAVPFRVSDTSQLVGLFEIQTCVSIFQTKLKKTHAVTSLTPVITSSLASQTCMPGEREREKKKLNAVIRSLTRSLALLNHPSPACFAWAHTGYS